MQIAEGIGGLREAKKRATRHQLTSAAQQLTLAKGLDEVTVEMVCAEVGVSVRTFFNYFSSKDEALSGDELPMGDEESRRRFVEGGPTGVLLDDMLAVVDPTAGLRNASRDEFRTGFAVMMQEPRVLARQLARSMQQEQQLAALVAQRQGIQEPDADCFTAAAITIALLRCAVARWVEADDSSPISAHLQTGLAAVVAALRST